MKFGGPGREHGAVVQGRTNSPHGAFDANEPERYYPDCRRNYARVIEDDDVQGRIGAAWALSLGAQDLRDVLPLCPPDCRPPLNGTARMCLMRGRVEVNTSRISARLPIEERRAAEQVARERGEPLSDLLRRALAREVAELREQAQEAAREPLEVSDPRSDSGAATWRSSEDERPRQLGA